MMKHYTFQHVSSLLKAARFFWLLRKCKNIREVQFLLPREYKKEQCENVWEVDLRLLTNAY